jgi:hypothetical protein
VSPVSSPPCTHDLGVGTTVCLRCRQEARQAVRARQQRLLTMIGLAAAGLVAVSIVGASTVNAWRAAARASRVHEMPTMVTAAITTSDVKSQGGPKAVVLAPIAPPTASKAIEPASVRSPLALVVPQGRTVLKDSVVAERVGDSVIVSFDLLMIRTRRRDKFEHIVRETLPAVYGARADSVLAAIPDGGLVGNVDLVTELPLRGIHLPLSDGYTLAVWPETRPGHDGPLVVRYRAKVVRG